MTSSLEFPAPLRAGWNWAASHPYWLVLPIATAAYLFQLGLHGLENVDEAIYAQIAKEMVRGGDWLTMHWAGEEWFEKPPLFVWLVALSYKAFGISEFSSRLVSALCGVGIAALTFAITRRVMGVAAAFLALVPLLSSYTLLRQARFCTTDALLALTFLAAVYIHLRWRAKGFVGIAACFAIGFMDKSVAAGLMFLGLFPFVLSAQLQESKRMFARVSAGVGLVLTLVLPWYLVMYHWYGAEFLSENIGYHILRRAAEGLEGNTGGLTYYPWGISYYFTGRYAALLLLIPAVLWSMPREKLRDMIILLAPPLIALLLLSIPRTKLYWYIFPVMPLLSAALACCVYWAFRTSDKMLLAGFGVLAVFGIWNDTRPILAIPVCLIALVAMAVSWPRPNLFRQATAGIGVVLMLLAVASTLRALNSTSPTSADQVAELALAVKSSGDGSDEAPLFLFNTRLGRTAVYYTDRNWCVRLEDLWRPEIGAKELNRCLADAPILHAIVSERHMPLLKRYRRANVVATSGELYYVHVER